MPIETPNGPQDGLSVSLSGTNVKLGTAVRIVTMLCSVVALVVAMNARVATVEAQVEANAAQNEIDKKTSLIVEFQQREIDAIRENSGKFYGALSEIKEELAKVNTKLGLRAGE
jgi:hypothetical protein